MTGIIIAAAQYPIDWLENWQAYEAKLTRWVEEAAAGGASIALFPEYGAMELASLTPDRAGDLHESLRVVSDLAGRVDDLHAYLASQHDVILVAASLPVAAGEGAPVNRTRIFAPNGKSGFQDKLVMTRFETEQWGIGSGSAVKVFETAIGKLGVAICYDSEFPLIARAMCEAGADVLLVPSCTDSLHGYWRVRLGCQARAMENQCLVVQSPTVGAADWSPAVDVNRGAAGVYAPPDGPFPDNGILACGELDQPAWVLAEVDLAQIRNLRRNGSVLNHRDWNLQPGAHALPAVELVDLTD